MFDIGFSELFIVAIVALMVLGPERLPRAARFTGLWVRRARAQWYSVKSELERELADDDLKKSLARTRDELRDLGTELQNQGRELHDDLRREGQGIEKSVKDAVAPVTRAATTGAAPALEHVAGGNAGNGPDGDAMTGAFDLEPPPSASSDPEAEGAEEAAAHPGPGEVPAPALPAAKPAADADASGPRP